VKTQTCICYPFRCHLVLMLCVVRSGRLPYGSQGAGAVAWLLLLCTVAYTLVILVWGLPCSVAYMLAAVLSTLAAYHLTWLWLYEYIVAG
jgi:hypothetical protein